MTLTVQGFQGAWMLSKNSYLPPMKELFVSFALTILYVAVNAQATLVKSPGELAKRTLTELTLERKVAQLVCAEIDGDAAADDPRMKQWLSLVKDYGIGGFVI